MKKILLILTTIFFFNISLVFAETCSLSEKNELSAYASNVKAGYTVESKLNNDNDEYFVINIYINNLTEKIYAEMQNIANGTIDKYYYSEANKGNINFPQNDNFEVYKYEIKIYANSGLCNGKLLKSMNIETSRFNPYYKYPSCKDIPEYILCQPFYNFNLGYDDFITRTANYKASLLAKKTNKENKNDSVTIKSKILSFFEDNKVITSFIAVLIIGGIGYGVFIVVKKKGKRLI